MEQSVRGWSERWVVAGTIIAITAVGGFAIGRSTASSAKSPSPSTVMASTTSTSPSTTATTFPGEVAAGPFAGTWVHHGIALHLTPDGYGTFTWRTYNDCASSPPPCDFGVTNEIFDGGYAPFGLLSTSPDSASGHVFETMDAAVVSLGNLTLRLDAQDDMVFAVFSNGQQLATCGPNARSPASNQCGA